MASNKPEKRQNKSDLIRAYLAKNPNTKPKAIVEALAKKGIVVTGALASNVVYRKDKNKPKAAEKPKEKRKYARRQVAKSKDPLVIAMEIQFHNDGPKMFELVVSLITSAGSPKKAQEEMTRAKSISKLYAERNK